MVEMKCTPYCHHCETKLDRHDGEHIFRYFCRAEEPIRELGWSRFGESGTEADAICNISPYRLAKEAADIASKAFEESRDAITLLRKVSEVMPECEEEKEAVQDAKNLD